MKLWIHPELAAWAGDDAFASAARQRGKIFRAKEGRRTLRFTHAGKNYFLKLHTGVGWREIMKNGLHLRAAVTGAENEWRALRQLRRLNIPTLRAVGFGARGCNPARRLSFLITAELANVITLHDLCAQWRRRPPAFALKQKVLRRVADIARIMHRNGINHRDFYLCHFFVEFIGDHPEPSARAATDGRADCKVYVMDLHRAQIRQRTPQRWRVKDLGGLYFSAADMNFTARDMFRFIKIYSGCELRESLRARNFWTRVARRGRRMRRSAQKKCRDK